MMTALLLPTVFAVTAVSAEAKETPASKKRAAADSKFTIPLAVEWKFTGVSFANNDATPIVTEDTVYFASGSRVYAVDTVSGSLKWKYPSDNFLQRLTTTTPVYADGTLFVGTGEGLYALDAKTGKLKYPGFIVPNGVAVSPVVIGDSVYFGAGSGRVYGLNTKTGEPITPAYAKGLDFGADLAGDFSVDNGLLYVVTTDQVLRVLDPTTGSQRWAHRMDADVRKVVPVAAGENLYVAAGSSLSNFRLNNGEPRWTLPLPSNASAPVAVDADDNAFVITSERYLYAIDSRGRSVWKIAPRVDYEVSARPIIAGDVLIVGTRGGGIYGYDRLTGELKWNYAVRPSSIDPFNVPIAVRVSSRPVSFGNGLFVLTDDGTLTAFRNDAADNTPPSVTRLDPEQGEYVGNQLPFRIGAKVLDDGSGLNVATMVFKIDATDVPRRRETDVLASAKASYTFDKDTGLLEYTIIESESGKSNTLADGHHTATLIAEDWFGNKVTKAWTFTVDSALRGMKRKSQQRTGGRPGVGGPGVGGGGGLTGGSGRRGGGAGGGDKGGAGGGSGE